MTLHSDIDNFNNHLGHYGQVYLLVHACEVKLKDGQRENIEKIQKTFDEAEAKESPGGPQISLEAGSPKLSLRVQDRLNEYEELDTNMNERIDGEVIETSITLEENTVNREDLNRASGEIFQNTHPGAVWDVFRRQDVPKLMEYLRVHWKDFGKTESLVNKCVSLINCLCDSEFQVSSHSTLLILYFGA